MEDSSPIKSSPNHGDKNSEVEVTDQLSVALKKIDLLEDEVECLTGVISVMKEDLQVKDEQFDYLYASIKARNEQYFEYKKAEDEQLRARLHQLDLENDLLQNQLRTATRKLNLLTWKTASKNSPFSNIPDDLMTYIISYLSPVELGRFMCTGKHSYSMGGRGRLWKEFFIREWGEVKAKTAWGEFVLECESGDLSQSLEGEKLNPADQDIWRVLFGRASTIDSNWKKGRGYMHICRGHSGTVTCLALPGAQNHDQDLNGNDDLNSKHFAHFLFSGSDDGSILLWNLNPPSQQTHHIHGKKKLSSSRNGGSFTQSPPSLSAPNSVLPDSEVSQIPLLPPPILPLAQLVEGRKSGRPSQSSINRRFHGAGAELHCLTTSPPAPAVHGSSLLSDRCLSPPRDMQSEPSLNCDLSPTTVRSLLPSLLAQAQAQVIRPIAPSLLRSNFHGHGGPIWAVDYDKDSNQLFSGSYDQTIKIWDAATGLCRRTLRGHNGWISSLCVLRKEEITVMSSDGSSTTETSGRVASASWDATIKIWNTTTGDVLSTMTSGIGNALYCMSALFEDQNTNQNALVAVGTRQCEVQEWSLQTNQRLHTYLGHGKEVHSVVLSPTLCISGSGDSSIKIWDRRSGICVQTLLDHKGSVMALQYDDGGSRLISGSYDKTVKIWDMRAYSSSSTSSLNSPHHGHGSNGNGNDPISLLCTISVEHPVFCLKSNPTQLVVGSTDHNFRVFDFSHYK